MTAVDGGPAEPHTVRVTHVYRREKGEWKIVHRHGDVAPVDQAARRGIDHGASADSAWTLNLPHIAMDGGSHGHPGAHGHGVGEPEAMVPAHQREGVHAGLEVEGEEAVGVRAQRRERPTGGLGPGEDRHRDVAQQERAAGEGTTHPEGVAPHARSDGHVRDVAVHGGGSFSACVAGSRPPAT
jgi:hypothetical protein